MSDLIASEAMTISTLISLLDFPHRKVSNLTQNRRRVLKGLLFFFLAFSV
jgi:hypothetical protein